MLNRGYDSRNKGIKAYNRRDYLEAINHFKEARGHARNAFNTEPADKHYKIHALLAECTTNIADAMLRAIPPVTPLNLDTALSTIDLVENTLIESKNYLVQAREALTKLLPIQQQMASEDLDNLEITLSKVQSKIMKDRINHYWNACVDELKAIEAQEEVIAKTERCSPEMIKSHHVKIQKVILLLKNAMAVAEKAKEQGDVNQIRDLIIDLYEKCGDFIPTTGNHQLQTLERQFTDFILAQYTNAFQLKRQKPGVTKEEIMPLFLSVLNVLETKVNQEKRSHDKSNDRLAQICIDIIRFQKDFLTADLQTLLSCNEKLEIQGYLLTAHRVLAKIQDTPIKREAHATQALTIARGGCSIAKGAHIPSGSALIEVSEKMHFYYAKNQFIKAIKGLQQSHDFTQDTIALIACALGRIHRNGDNGQLVKLFMCSNKKIAPNLSLAIELFVKARNLTTNNKFLKYCDDNIKLILNSHKAHFNTVFHFNPHLQMPIMDDKSKVDTRKLSKDETKSELVQIISDYLLNIKSMFTKSEISHAFPGILSKIAETLRGHHYNEIAIKELETIFLDITSVLNNLEATVTVLPVSTSISSNQGSTLAPLVPHFQQQNSGSFKRGNTVEENTSQKIPRKLGVTYPSK